MSKLISSALAWGALVALSACGDDAFTPGETDIPPDSVGFQTGDEGDDPGVTLDPGGVEAGPDEGGEPDTTADEGAPPDVPDEGGGPDGIDAEPVPDEGVPETPAGDCGGACGAGELCVDGSCVWPHDRWCWPCASDAECAPGAAPAGVDLAWCVSEGPSLGSFCASACETDEDCPEAGSCVPADVGGETISVCKASAGECECAQEAVDASAQTPCTIANAFGSCSGIRLCTGLGLSKCTATTPQAELCNNADDNCNDQVDEGFEAKGAPCDGDDLDACNDGVFVCAPDGSLSCTDDAASIAEICNDKDDDCDGEIDEAWPDKGAPCDGDDPDSCEDGMLVCGGPDTLVCDDAIGSTPEACNGVDDDCDGETDEDFGLLGQPCDGGDADQCEDGVYVCDGVGLACDDDATSLQEQCNNADDDCDGSVDEGLVQDCSSPCGNGVETCVAGVWQGCTAEPQKTCLNYATCQNIQTCDAECQATPTEVCNLVDDDCDGTTDEGFYGDPSNGSDFPNAWSAGIPEIEEYPAKKSGTITGRVLPQGDQDWFTIEANEDLSDFCVNDSGDEPIKASITFTSPGNEWYEICMCWSSASTFCAETSGGSQTCAISMGGPVTINLNMKMDCGSTDKGYLDVVVRPENTSLDVSCDTWTAAWAISE